MKFKKPYRIRRKKSIFKNRFFWLFFFFAVIFGTGMYIALFSQFFQIQKIHVFGQKSIPREYIENITQEKISQEIFTFPTKSIFLADLKEIETAIFENFPELAEVNLKRNLPDSLIVEAREREPLFLWCQDSGPCFHLDKEGVIFNPVRNDIPNGVEEAPPESALIKIKSQMGELKLGKKVIEKEIVDFLQKANLKLKDLGILTKEFQISEDKITAQTDQGWQIFLNSKEDPEKQIFNLSLVFQEEIPPEKRENLEYIDLRFGNRVYYKYRGEPANY